MRVEWFGQSAFHLDGSGGTVAIDPVRGHVGAEPRPWDPVGLPRDRRRGAGSAAGHARARRPQRASRRSTASRTRCARPPGTLRVAAGQVTAIASEHDERRARNAARTRSSYSSSTACAFVTWATSARAALREEQAAAIGDGRPAVRAGRRRLHDRCRAGGGDRRAPVAALGRADALPHAADRVPGDGRGVPAPALTNVSSACGAAFETAELPPADGPLVVVPAAP